MEMLVKIKKTLKIWQRLYRAQQIRKIVALSLTSTFLYKYIKKFLYIFMYFI